MKPFGLTKKQFSTRIFYYLRQFFDADLSHYAASLSFYTLSAIIPLLLIILTTLTKLPSFLQYYTQIKSFLVENLLPTHSQAFTNYIDTFLANTLQLSLLSLIVMFVTSLFFFQNFEYIVNKIFQVPARNFWHSLGLYLLLVTLSPIALALSFYLSSNVELFLNTHIFNFFNTLINFSSYLIIWGVFFILYKFSPNTHVKTNVALISSFIISLTWNLSKHAFITYVFYSKTYTTMYGSFSVLLFLFLWIYISWLVFIYGLKLCHLMQGNKQDN